MVELLNITDVLPVDMMLFEVAMPAYLHRDPVCLNSGYMNETVVLVNLSRSVSLASDMI